MGPCFATKFKVNQVSVGCQKAVLGFSIHTSLTLQQLKNIISMHKLQKNHIYFYIQCLDFEHSINLHLMGYIVKEHPTFSNQALLEKDINNHCFNTTNLYIPSMKTDDFHPPKIN
jgi:hypothetical protein